MNSNKPVIPSAPAVAAAQALFLSPALLFMGSQALRVVASQDVAMEAHRVVMWYAGRMWTLWMLLLLLPFFALSAGCIALYSGKKRSVKDGQPIRQLLMLIRSQVPAQLIAAVTLMSAAVLGIVILHMAAS